MKEQKVTLEEFVCEVEDMLQTCFEGEAVRTGTAFLLTLPGGKKFSLQIGEGD